MSFPSPTPPSMPYVPGGFRPQGQNTTWEKFKPLIGFLVCLFVIFAVYKGWTDSVMEAVGIKEPAVTPTAVASEPTPNLMATIAAMQANGPQIVTQTVIMSQTAPISVSNSDINAIATMAVKEYQLNLPARPNSKSKLLVGSIRLDDRFGYCDKTNIGFVASGQPYFLKVAIDKLPSQDLYNSQIQVEGLEMKSDNCQFPLLEVVDIRFSGLATPSPLNLSIGGPIVTQPMTMANRYTGTFPSVAPTTNNPALKDIPFNGPDGKPLPTATPEPTATMTKSNTVNLIGTILQAEGCPDSNFTLATSSGEFLILFATLPTVSPLNYEVLVAGEIGELCGRKSIRVTTISYVPTATPHPTDIPNPTRTPRPTDTPTATATPIKVMLSGQMTALGGCDLAPYGITQGDKVYYLLFDNLNIPPQNQPILIRGLVSYESACFYPILRVIDFAIPTPTPTSLYTPTVTPTPSDTPTVTPTIEMIDNI